MNYKYILNIYGFLTSADKANVRKESLQNKNVCSLIYFKSFAYLRKPIFSEPGNRIQKPLLFDFKDGLVTPELRLHLRRAHHGFDRCFYFCAQKISGRLGELLTLKYFNLHYYNQSEQLSIDYLI
jgi:hypothetical protein